MIYRLLVLACFLSCSILSSAQDVEILDDTSTAEGPSGEIIAPKTFVVNQDDSALELYWKRARTDIPNAWQNPGVCDKNACYDNADSATFRLEPGDTSQLKINFYAYDNDFKGVDGRGALTIEVGRVNVQDSSATNSPQEAYFSGSAFNTGASGVSARAKALTAYPNPVQKKLNLRFQNPGQFQIRLFNVVGKPVRKMSLQGNVTTLSVSDLEPGVYILRYQTDSGKEGVKRIFKR